MVCARLKEGETVASLQQQKNIPALARRAVQRPLLSHKRRANLTLSQAHWRRGDNFPQEQSCRRQALLCQKPGRDERENSFVALEATLERQSRRCEDAKDTYSVAESTGAR
jgi:hypothetical protein